ncbi:MAG: HAMP domain-containing sensor histidine kinase [Catonella sp.]|nr:HAMP domain-containing sensor histidine kinase [Catonella sp.]
MFEVIILALIAAGLFLLAFYKIGNYAADNYYNTTDYSGRMDRKYIAKLQKYVDANGVRSGDTDKLNKWVDDQNILSIFIIKNGELTYNSWEDDNDSSYFTYNDTDESELSGKFYLVTFADGECKVYVTGFYSYNAYVYIEFIAIAGAAVIFILIMLLAVRSKIKYVKRIDSDVKVLESGDLAHNVSVAGNDEFSELAKSINQMKNSLKEEFEEKEAMHQAEKTLVTGMSHDLRTPLTSILLYTDLLLKGKYEDENKMWEYIGRINEKAKQMKNLSDQLFEYSLVTGKGGEIVCEKSKIKDVLYDPLSEMIGFLSGSGYKTASDVDFKDVNINFYRDYIPRLIDNIISNIGKYADKENPVIIKTVYEEGFAGISVSNSIRTDGTVSDTNHIGLMNIKKMMAAMDGKCMIEKGGTEFTIKLLFVVHHEVMLPEREA